MPVSETSTELAKALTNGLPLDAEALAAYTEIVGEALERSWHQGWSDCSQAMQLHAASLTAVGGMR